jgi:hypothetical protein
MENSTDISTDGKYSNSSDESSLYIFIRDVAKAFGTEDNKSMEECARRICWTRDIRNGEGKWNLTYKYLMEFAIVEYLYTGELERTQHILYHMVHPLPQCENNSSYGSWKDIKYFLNYATDYVEDHPHRLSLCEKSYSHPYSHPYPYAKVDSVVKYITDYCINMYIIQLKDDLESYKYNEYDKISLCAKWVPRERYNKKTKEFKKHSWIFERLALTIFGGGITYPKNKRDTCKKYLRKLISTLNKKLDTVEIKQCAKMYSTIDYNNVPSTAMQRQDRAFRNKRRLIKLFPEKNRSKEADRHDGAYNLRMYYRQKKEKSENSYKKEAPKKLDMYDDRYNLKMLLESETYWMFPPYTKLIPHYCKYINDNTGVFSM